MRRWRAYLAFSAAAACDTELAVPIRGATAARIANIKGLLRTTHGEARGCVKADRLPISLVQGVSLQAIVAPQDWPEDLIRTNVAESMVAALSAARL